MLQTSVFSALLQRILLIGVLFTIATGQTIPAANTAENTNSPEAVEADNLNRQVVKLFSEKKYSEALPLAKRALELRTNALGATHAKTLISLENLGAIETRLEKHDAAINTYKRLLEGQEKLYGKTDMKLGKSLSALGWAYLRSENQAAAEASFKREVQIFEKAYGAENEQLLPALADLAIHYQHFAQHPKSIKTYQRMITIAENSPLKQSKQQAEWMIKCAVSLRINDKKEEIAEAEKLEERARTIYASLNPTNKQIQQGGGVLQGYALLRVQPGYPFEAKSKRVKGSVQVLVTIDEAGIVTAAKAVAGPIELHRDSEEAAKKWRFAPTELQGVPVKVQGILTFNFTLQ